MHTAFCALWTIYLSTFTITLGSCLGEWRCHSHFQSKFELSLFINVVFWRELQIRQQSQHNHTTRLILKVPLLSFCPCPCLCPAAVPCLRRLRRPPYTRCLRLSQTLSALSDTRHSTWTSGSGVSLHGVLRERLVQLTALVTSVTQLVTARNATWHP